MNRPNWTKVYQTVLKWTEMKMDRSGLNQTKWAEVNRNRPNRPN